MQRREFLVGALATAVAATVATPALSSILGSLKPVEPEDYCVKFSDVLWEACNKRVKFANIADIRTVLANHWLESRNQGKKLHLIVDMKHMADRVNDTRYFPSTYIADKVSVKNPDGTYKMIKDRTKVIEHAKA